MPLYLSIGDRGDSSGEFGFGTVGLWNDWLLFVVAPGLDCWAISDDGVHLPSGSRNGLEAS